MLKDAARRLFRSGDTIFLRDLAAALYCLAVHFGEADGREIEGWEIQHSTSLDLDSIRAAVETLAAAETGDVRVLFSMLDGLRERQGGLLAPRAGTCVTRTSLLGRVGCLFDFEKRRGYDHDLYTRELVGKAMLVVYLLDRRTFGEAGVGSTERELYAEIFGREPELWSYEIVRAADIIWWETQREEFDRRAARRRAS